MTYMTLTPFGFQFTKKFLLSYLFVICNSVLGAFCSHLVAEFAFEVELAQKCLSFLHHLTVRQKVRRMLAKIVPLALKFLNSSFSKLRRSWEHRFWHESGTCLYFENLMWIFQNIACICSNFGLWTSKWSFSKVWESRAYRFHWLASLNRNLLFSEYLTQ